VSYTTYPKLYMRIKGNVPASVEDFPKAFVTPYEDTAAGRKRQDTVDSWAQGYGSWNPETGKTEYPEDPGPTVLDNVPLTGFSFGGVVSRYRTSNKFFEIRDPRGFTLEIDTYNLLYLVERAVISKGVIESPLIWARGGGGNSLVLESDTVANSAKKTGGLSSGDVIEVAGVQYTYVGQYFVSALYIKQEYLYRVTGKSRYYPYRDEREVEDRWHDVNIVDSPKKVWVLYSNDANYLYTVYKSAPKHVKVSSGEPAAVPTGVITEHVTTNGYGDYKNGSCLGYYFFDSAADQVSLDRGLDRVKSDLEETVSDYNWYTDYHSRDKRELIDFSYDGVKFKLTPRET
jgi:hypothetical protein